MKLFKNKCNLCQREFSIIQNGVFIVQIKDGYACSECIKKAGQDPCYLSFYAFITITTEDLRKQIEAQNSIVNYKDNSILDQNQASRLFQPNIIIGKKFKVDEKNKLWCVCGNSSILDFSFNSQIFDSSGNGKIYSFSDIVSYELLEDENAIVKSKAGLGSAATLGVAFGATGAIVGALTSTQTSKTKLICDSLKVQIGVNDLKNPVIFINLINFQVYKKSMRYKQKFKEAQEIISILKIMIPKEEKQKIEIQNSVPLSIADEILKFQELLTKGIITEEEFVKKKKELLEL